MAAAPGLAPDELTAAKGYMRVEDSTEDGVVTACVLAARAYLAQAGVSLPGLESPRRPLYDLVCHALALGSYDLRGPEVAGSAMAENPQLRRSINQLKFTEPEG